MTENEKDRVAQVFERNHWRFSPDGVDGKPDAWRITLDAIGEVDGVRLRRKARVAAEEELGRPMEKYEIAIRNRAEERARYEQSR